jgi:ACS family tartrate transporter-like MFS transporter
MYYTDSVIEESAVRMLLWRLLPPLCLLSLADMLNRLSLGYAETAMGAALHLGDMRLRIAINLFSVGYLAAGLPAAWLLLRVGARRWITVIVLVLAGIAIAQALVLNAASLYAVRLLLGVAEASLLPALIFYITQWMPEAHRAKAIAPLIATAALVPILSGPGSDVLLLLGGWFGVSNWLFLFMVEGLATLWLGLHVPGGLPRAPDDRSWLPASERLWLRDQLSGNLAPGTATRFVRGLRSPSIWKLAAVLGITGLVGGSLGLWVPLAMQPAGYLPPNVGAGIMIAASVIGVAGAAAIGLVAGRRSHWRLALALCLTLAGISLGAAAVLPFGTVAVLMLAIVAATVPPIVALTWVLAPYVVAGDAAAAGFAVLSMAGTLGYFIAPRFAMVRSDAAGRCVVLAVACLVAAWLARGLDGRHPAEQTAPVVSRVK